MATKPGLAIIEQYEDRDAQEIGGLYRKSGECIVDNVRYLWEAGQRLAAKKQQLGHGRWLPWIEANREALGFDKRAAQRLIGLSNTTLTTHLTPEDAAELSRSIWGNAHNHRAQGTGENEWYTPPQYIEAARKVLGVIELDPASSEIAQRAVQAQRYFTVDDNGLAQPWAGTVWLNPPYSQPEIGDFCQKLVTELTEGNVTEAILLTHNYTDTGWFHMAESIAAAICFTKGRIKFVDQDGGTCAPTQGQAFFYYGEAQQLFREVFSDFGFIR